MVQLNDATRIATYCCYPRRLRNTGCMKLMGLLPTIFKNSKFILSLLVEDGKLSLLSKAWTSSNLRRNAFKLIYRKKRFIKQFFINFVQLGLVYCVATQMLVRLNQCWYLAHFLSDLRVRLKVILNNNCASSVWLQFRNLCSS